MMYRGAIYGLGAAAIWGGMYVVSDVVLQTIRPFTLLTIRLVMGALMLALIVWRSGTHLPKWPDSLRLMGVGLVGFGVSVGMQFVGTDKSTAVNGALVTSASPAFILIFAALILREKLTSLRIAAVVLATLGVIVIVNPQQADFTSQTFIGDMALVVASVTWGLYSVLVRRVSTQHDTLVVTLFAFMGGLLLSMPVMLVELSRQPMIRLSGDIMLGILYLGIISTAGAMWLWNRAFALVDASIAALFFFAQPLVGALLGWLLLGQAMTIHLWIGSALIVVGVLLSLTTRSRRQSEQQPV